MSVAVPPVFCVLPDKAETSVEAVLHGILQSQRLPPFHASSVRFVKELSAALLAEKSIRVYPEIMALAHWFRAASVQNLEERLQHSSTPGVSLPKGLVFHIAPSNVDSVFVYSWLLSLLCGNANVVRISRRPSNQIDAFVQVATRVLRNVGNTHIASTNVVLTYEHDIGISKAFSNACQLRVVWGGDATVAQMRMIPLPPLSSELVFPNRFSLAVIASAAVLDLTDTEVTDLGRRFYNDAFWFNQQACSSPRVIVWLGSHADITAAKVRFWRAIHPVIERLMPENNAGNVANRVTTIYRVAQSRRKAAVVSGPATIPGRIAADDLAAEDREYHDGNYVFIELERPTLEALPPLLRPIDQTITTFGIDREAWLPLLPSFPPHAADRIVPIGSALEFNAVWDGQDLLRSFTRTVLLH